MSKLSWYYRYGIRGFVSLVFNKLYTIVFYKSARLIRRPFYLRGWKWIDIGLNLTTGVGCRIEAICLNEIEFSSHKIIKLGNNIQINDYVHIAGVESIFLGNNVLIASKVFISDHNHGTYEGLEFDSSPNTVPNDRPIKSKPVVIEDNVWIGESVSILPGVTIGKGSVVGANSVVTKSVPQFSIVAGSPAKVIKEYNFEIKRWILKEQL